MLYSLPDGPQLDLCGQPRVHANPSAAQESDGGQMMTDISGPSSSSSFRSADLQRFLASKLHQNLDVHGSLEYLLTWKVWTMPSREPICALRASARRTSDNDCTGVPLDGWKSSKATEGTLWLQVQMKGWTTPQAHDSHPRGAGNRQNPRGGNACLAWDARLAGWGTPASRDWRDGRAGQETMQRNSRPLNEQVVHLAGWNTPLRNDAEKRGVPKVGACLAGQYHLGIPMTSSTVETEKSGASHGALNPAFSLWLMGYPRAWVECGLAAMKECIRLRRG